jgi:2-haloacid dehalogenase
MLETAFRAAGLMGKLDALLSVEDVGIFKPAPEVYQLGLDRYDANPAEILFVSSNGWDACAAGQFGFQTVWANRAQMPIERLANTPDHIVSDLRALAKHL